MAGYGRYLVTGRYLEFIGDSVDPVVDVKMRDQVFWVMDEDAAFAAAEYRHGDPRATKKRWIDRQVKRSYGA